VTFVFILEEDQVDAGGNDEDGPRTPPTQIEPVRQTDLTIQP
jgi:hypothetical protein